QAYCEIAKLGDQMEQANEKRDSKKFDELARKMDELAKTLGAEYAALMDGLPDIDPGSEDGKEIASTFDELDKLCGRKARPGRNCLKRTWMHGISQVLREKPGSKARIREYQRQREQSTESFR